jgi:hypothetical protein
MCSGVYTIQLNEYKLEWLLDTILNAHFEMFKSSKQFQLERKVCLDPPGAGTYNGLYNWDVHKTLLQHPRWIKLSTDLWTFLITSLSVRTFALTVQWTHGKLVEVVLPNFGSEQSQQSLMYM